MSLWLQSLDYCLYDCEDNPEKRAKCILAHLSMTVPRSWWENALESNSAPGEGHISILRDLRMELLEVSGPTEQIGFDVLVALAFADEDPVHGELKYGTVDSQCSIEEFLARGREILAKRPELSSFAELIAEKANSLPQDPT